MILSVTLFMTFLLFGCNISNCNDEEFNNSETREMKLFYHEGNFENDFRLDHSKMDASFFESEYYDETIGIYEKAVIPNKEMALEICNTIIKGMQDVSEQLAENEYVPFSIFYDTEKELWIVSYFARKGKEEFVGNGWSIALRKCDGKVLKIWSEE